MSKVNVMFARFPGGNAEHPATTDWLLQTVLKCKADPRIAEVQHWRISDTPITMGRNLAIENAKHHGADFLLMLDADMHPDMYLGQQGAVPFWDVAFDFAFRHEGPCAIAAPYCGPPPCENIYIFRWATLQSDHPNIDMRLDQFSREEAAVRTGIEEVAALPTGLFLLDMRAIDRLEPPYFYYEWSDSRELKKASTEDVAFTRDLSLQGVPQYCLWDAWAGHYKQKLVGRPGIINPETVSGKFRRALAAGEAVPSVRTSYASLNGEDHAATGKRAAGGAPAGKRAKARAAKRGSGRNA